MDIGIGLPNAVRGVDRAGTVEWARRAEAAGFSSLGTIDRIAFANYESLIALAAAAAVTERIRLVTDVLLAPPRRNTALLAKQVATLDHLSEGRVVLGLAPGAREPDFEVSGADFAARGPTFEAQLEELRAIWRGESDVGPPPWQEGGPPVLVGGARGPAFRRAARFGDGWTFGGGTPEMFAAAFEALQAEWSAAGRSSAPRTMALLYYALGDRAEALAREDLADYYSFLGPEVADMIVQSAATDEETVQRALQGFEQVGCDEVICFPTGIDPEQVDLLAAAVLPLSR
jgi:alkanesulfonate monooxygenase SsuD/methylene tetrahydromethanopterin reductase-like flavin-dependent oxidoreductase (luciferase family)